jgi:hypothetical protein
MNDAVDVEEIMERIRATARARAHLHDAPQIAPESLSFRERVKNLWRTALWYTQNPVEFPNTLTDRVLLARAIEELRVVVSQMVQRLDNMAECIEELSVRFDGKQQSDSESGDVL